MIEFAMDFRAEAKVVKHFPYRTAEVVNRIMRIRYDSADEMDYIHRNFAAEASGRPNGRPDNHECYQVEYNGATLYFEFSDWNCYIGTKIRDRPT